MENSYFCPMIKRKAEKKLTQAIAYFPVIGIIGPRQVGKTTLAKIIRKDLLKPSVYIDLENPRDLVKLSDPNLFFEHNSDKCVFLDEIQLMPELFSVLRPMVDMDRKPGRYILLGSASPVLIRKSSESLAGRIAYIELTGFNLTEVGGDKIRKLWLRGGFPNAFLAPGEDIWKQWLDNFIKTYLERDLPLLGLNIGVQTLRNLWTMIAHSHGSVINFSNFSRSLELSSVSVRKYFDFLENAFLVRQLQPFFPNVKKRIVRSPKIYIRDSGILHFLLNIDSEEVLEGHPMKGNSWEGFVVEQILQVAGSDYQAYFYRTHQGAECDLVLVRSSKPVFAIEIKYAAAPKLTKGNILAFEDIGAEYNFIITPDTEEYPVAKNIRVCSLRSFLEKHFPGSV